MMPMSDAAEHRADEVADAAEHGRGERDQAEPHAEVVGVARVRGDVQHAGRAGQRAAESEHERDGAVDVDAHQPGAVLVGATARMALPCLVLVTIQVISSSSGTVTASTRSSW